jgi:hypothetical protein
VNIKDLAKLTGKTIEELEEEFKNSDCISINLNDKK